jgi:hypothetical protein
MRLFAVLLLVLAFAAPAAAAGPRFALFDLQTDLAKASRNAFGDVETGNRDSLAGHGTLARCAAWCRFGDGWLAFNRKPQLGHADVTDASVAFSKRRGWIVELSLRPAARARWSAFAQRAAAVEKQRGVPDVLVVVAAGQIAATPYTSQITSRNGRLTLTGFSRASANALLKSLR